MMIEEKREQNLPFIAAKHSFCDGLAPEFARSPIHRNRVYSVIQLIGMTEPPESVSILEVGCGMGHVSAALAHTGFQVHGIDVDDTTVTAARSRHTGPRLDFACKDVSDTDLSLFDVIVLTEVLEHVRDYRAFMRLIADGMKPQSRLILTVPNGRCWSEILCRPSYWLKTTRLGKPVVSAIKKLLGTRDVTTANEMTPHVQFFTVQQMARLFDECRFVVEATHAYFYTWPVYETFFSESTLDDGKARADYERSLTKAFQSRALWSYALRKL